MSDQNGADALLKSLASAGVEVCFANPGTSELLLLDAMQKAPDFRAVLCLFEGVVSGAADGYGRMAEKPAATLLHLGSGFSNSMANLHNAKRARTPMVNLVGEHAYSHQTLNAPLASDIVGHVKLTSDWWRVAKSAESLAKDGVEAVAAANTGRLANVIVPADCAWDAAGVEAIPTEQAGLRLPPADSLSADIKALDAADGAQVVLFLGGNALQGEGLEAAGRIAALTGWRLISEVFPARLQRGQGRPVVPRLPYFGAQAEEMLAGTTHLVLCGAQAPVTFFAYPDAKGELTPDGCTVMTLARPGEDAATALVALADFLEAPAVSHPARELAPEPKSGPLTPKAMGAIMAAQAPDDLIVSDESITCGAFIGPYFDAAAPHDWMTLTGGAIGQGLPLATGAAVACPARKVLALQADGSAMYTHQALWTIAREALDVCVVILANHNYAILHHELGSLGVTEPDPRTSALLTLDNPRVDWVSLAKSLGVDGIACDTVEAFSAAFQGAMSRRGPFLIEACLRPV